MPIGGADAVAPMSGNTATTLLFPLLIQLVGIFYHYLSPYLSPIDLIAASRPRSTVTGP